MRDVTFTAGAIADLKKLPIQHRERILKKISFFKSLDDPRTVAKPMVNIRYGHRRRRVGAYRIIFDIDEYDNLIIVLVVGHRGKVYK